MTLATFAVAAAIRNGWLPYLVGGQGDMHDWLTQVRASSSGWPCQYIMFSMSNGSFRMLG